jgi:hypothetical protein
MHEIVRCIKGDTGIDVLWHEKGKTEENHNFFSFSEIKEMRIQIDDLIEHPGLYRFDLQRQKIYRSAKGGGSF